MRRYLGKKRVGAAVLALTVLLGFAVPVMVVGYSTGRDQYGGGPGGGDVNACFVIDVYFDFLHRPPTPAELAAALAGLKNGTLTRGELVARLAHSHEWIEGVINRLYHDTLGRPGDAGGVAYWVKQLADGKLTVSQVAAAFYASVEYYEGIGGHTVPGWVSDLYAKLLQRSADAKGLAYWVAQARSAGRTSVAGRFFDSQESRLDRVQSLYQTLLQRAPDPSGAQYWSGRIGHDGDLSLAAFLAASHEYQSNCRDHS